MQDYFKVIAPALPSELVAPDIQSKLQTLATMLPPLSSGLLECRLHETSEQVDFSVSFNRSIPTLNLELLCHPGWKTIHKFCSQWLEQTYHWYQHINHLWLEIDLHPSYTRHEIPSIFLGLKQIEPLILIDLIAKISQLFQQPISVQQARMLDRCVESLPNGARIQYFAIMLSRSSNAVRLNVKGMTLSQTLQYLEQIGYNESLQPLLPQMASLSHLVDHFVLTFDVDEMIHSRIGLECFLNDEPDNKSRWAVFLDYLICEGVCTRAKRNALLTWPRAVQKTQVPDLWPDHLGWMEQLLGQTMFSVFRCTINHIKLVYQPESIEAKAYLAFQHIFGDRASLGSSPLNDTVGEFPLPENPGT